MSAGSGARERNGSFDAATVAARALEAVAHGRAHLAYQRRVATTNLHRDDVPAVFHTRKDAA